jgi:phytoene dehydrogenase-like protein
VAATILARAGRSVLVLERRGQLGGAAISGAPFPHVGARLSRYAYLVSLFPAALAKSLGLKLELSARDVLWYAPEGDGGLLADAGGGLSGASIPRGRAGARTREAWQRFNARVAGVAQRVFPTMTEPLRARDELRALIADEFAWSALFDEPLSALLEPTFESDLLRGVVCTDATIGTFAPAGDRLLRQNRCFLYHVIGNGTGRWDVPVGGMGALTDELASLASAAGAQIHTRTEVTALATDETIAEVTCAEGQRFQAAHVLVNAAPAVLSQMLGETGSAEPSEGSQLKINMLLARLPRLKDPEVRPEQAFAGTFHVNEAYEQLDRAYREAAAGAIPSLPPCELYCHSLTDPSILSAELRTAGAHTLTLFGLHMPARLFRGAPEERKHQAVAATMRSVSSVLAEPLEDCLWRTSEGEPCLEALTPVELERELAMPGGHIFHRDLAWPYAESESEIGKWGAETAHRNVWLCGAGARRGGGVSGIPGHNGARAVLAAG